MGGGGLCGDRGEGRQPRFGPKDAVVLLCGCLNQAVVIFFILGLNTLFPEWRDSFHADRAATASVQGVCVGMTTGGGLVAGMLVRQLGARKSLLLGCVMATGGAFAGGFVTSLPALLVCVGMVAGGGQCMTNVTNINCCLQRFSSRANVVSSLMTVGSGLTMLIAPFFFRYFTELYSWRGCLIMSSAVTLQTFIFSLLVTSPLLHTDHHAPNTKPPSPVATSRNSTSDRLEPSPGTHDTEEAGPLLVSSHPRGSPSVLETAFTGDETPTTSQGKRPADLDVALKTPVSQNPSVTEGTGQSDRETQLQDTSCEHEDRGEGLEDISRKQRLVDAQHVMSNSCDQDQPPCPGAAQERLHIQDTIAGDLSRSTPANGSLKENRPLHQTEETEETISFQASNQGSRVRTWLHNNARFLGSPVFLALTLFTMLCHSVVTTFHILILDYSRHQGWALEDGLLLNSLYLISNITSRVLAVALSCLLRSFNGVLFLAAGGMVGGVSAFLLGQVSGYVVAGCLYVGMGLTYSCIVTMFPPCILKVTGPRDYPLGLGLVFSLMGVTTVACTTFAGYMVDSHGHYMSLCYVYGLTVLVVTTLLLLVTRCGRSTTTDPRANPR